MFLVITFDGALKHLELNAFKSVFVFNVLQSIRLLGEAAISFTDHYMVGIKRIAKRMEQSLMLITVVVPHISLTMPTLIANGIKNAVP